MEKIKTRPVVAGKAFDEELHAMSIKAITNTNPDGYCQYGTPCYDVVTSRESLLLSDVRVKTWSFQVPDDELGVQTVAKAVGYGMANVDSCCDEFLEVCRKYGMIRKVKDGVEFVEFTKPVFMASLDTRGWRVVWGGVKCNHDCLVYNDDVPDPSDCLTDFYDLRPKMEDGGCLVQSSSSSAVIKAEKKASIWTITLTLPILEDGRKVGRGYESCFRSAYNQYCRRLKKKMQS